MCVDGGVADVEFLSDLGVGQPGSDEAKDLLFACREIAEFLRRRGRGMRTNCLVTRLVIALPIVRGTTIQVSVEHLPDGRTPPKDLWLFHAGPHCTPTSRL